MATKKSSKKHAKSSETRPAKRKKILSLAEYEGQSAAVPAAEPIAIDKNIVTAEKKKRSSGLEAAAAVLAESGKPMNCGDMVKQMLEKGLWKTGGKTPAATIYAAIVREITVKGNASRFAKTDRGMFELTAVGKEAK